MSLTMQRYMVEAFENFINLPENEDRLFEFVGGKVVEVPFDVYYSYISVLIAAPIMTFVLQNKLGYVTGEAGGYHDTKEVQVHTPSQTVQVLTLGDTITGGNVLPDFEMAVDDIFPDDEETES